MYDIAIFSFPYIAVTAPAAAPALLKGYLKTQGFKVLAQDYNVLVKQRLDPMIYNELMIYWVSTYSTITLSDNTKLAYESLLEDYAQKIAKCNTRWVAFSVFSSHSRKFLEDFLPRFQKYNTNNTKVVLGGHGLDVLWVDSMEKYIDTYINSEGEIALRELLKGNLSYPGIASPAIQIDDLDQLGHADYSDYDLMAGYETWYDGPMIQITGSRGCVRDCTFCNVGSIWEKFKYRSGRSMADEIINNYELTGIKYFYFTDSLINGNVRELVNMMKILTEYKTQTNAPITWGGQWISRSQKGLPKDYYSLIASSGGFGLTMGVETGSDKVRAHMKKNFTNADLDAEMEQFSRHGITCSFFIMMGYPTETLEDFKDTLRMFKRYTKYVADGTIVGIVVGKGYNPALPGTPLANMGIVSLAGKTLEQWKSDVAEANYLESIRRRLIAEKVLNALKWPSSDLEFELRPILDRFDLLFNEDDRPLIEELLQKKNLDVDEEFLPSQLPQDIEVSLTLTGTKGLDYPIVDIQINQDIHRSILVEETQTFTFQVKKRARNMIKISLRNKSPNDTIVQDDKIIDDKTVKIKQLLIDEVRLQQPTLYMQGRSKTSDYQRFKHDALYYNDSTWSFYFKNPVNPYFIKKKKFYWNTKLETTSHLLQKISDMFTEYVNH
jgi:radical SAM superfamily enzyme YgiQ (UPF0313 family)